MDVVGCGVSVRNAYVWDIFMRVQGANTHLHSATIQEGPPQGNSHRKAAGNHLSGPA